MSGPWGCCFLVVLRLDVVLLAIDQKTAQMFVSNCSTELDKLKVGEKRLPAESGVLPTGI
jgi:hypothetical protein